MIGTFLDKYEVLQKIGEGGMATVYRARHTTLGREVAVKVLHPHLSAVARNRRRFAREARAIEHLNHDNIVQIFDYSGSDAEDCYIVTEFVEGQTLRQLIEARGLLPSEVASLIGARLAAALQYAHDAGIIHRDLKPENVMLRSDGTVKLMDFGIARFLDESSVTMTGALVGSPAYMSPEQAMEMDLDQRSDLFSLGTLLFHLVTGQLPYAGTNPSVILRKIIEGNRREVLDVQPGVDPGMAEIIDRLLETQPDARYEAARAVELALDQVLKEAKVPTGPDWTLFAYLKAEDAFEERLKEHLNTVLLNNGRSALRAGDHLIAQRMFNRLLAQDPHHEEVLTLLSDLHQRDTDEVQGRRRLAGMGGAIIVLLLGVLAWWGMTPPDRLAVAEKTPEPDIFEQIQPQGLDAVALDDLLLAPRPRVTRLPETERAVERSPGTRVGVRSLITPLVETRPTKDVAEAEPALGADLPPEPAWVVVTLGKPGYANVFVDGKRVGQTPNEGTRFQTTAGIHELLLSNPAGKDFRTTFEVEAGQEAEFKGVLLQRKPISIVFRDTLSGACSVRQDGQELGTLRSIGRNLVIADSERMHLLEIRCPDGHTETQRLGPKQAGPSVYLGPVP